MKALGEKLHDMGFKYGIYTDRGGYSLIPRTS